MVTLFQLNSFCCVVEEGSFRAAAERLFVSQPSVSQHIASLENYFGVSLFNRQKRRVRLTPEGRLLYSTAKEILNGLDDVEKKISNLQSVQAGNITIGFSPYTANSLAPKVIGNFIGSFPAVKVSIVTGDMSALEQKLKESDLELAITERKLNVNIGTDMICHSLGEEELVFVAAAGIALPQGPVSPEDMGTLPVITYSPDNMLASYLDDFAIQNQVRFDNRLQVDNPEAAGCLAAEGLGIALLTRTAAASAFSGKETRILELAASAPARLEIFAMYHRTQGLTYAGWEMLKLLEKTLPEVIG